MQNNSTEINLNKFFTIETENKKQFIQIPKQFIHKNSKYFAMNPMTKLLYGILADRNSLSIKNGWIDDKGRIFFIFTQSELCEQLAISAPTLRKYLKELEQNNLLYRKRQGLNLPDLMYLLQVDTEENILLEHSSKLKEKILPSRDKENLSQEKINFSSNNTNLNNNNLNNTDIEKKSVLDANDINIKQTNNISSVSFSNHRKNRLEVILPDEIIPLANKSFIQRLKADREFIGMNFNTSLYNLLIDAVTITCEKDKVDILSMNQYAYFKTTLLNMLRMQNIKNTNKIADYTDDYLFGW